MYLAKQPLLYYHFILKRIVEHLLYRRPRCYFVVFQRLMLVSKVVRGYLRSHPLCEPVFYSRNLDMNVFSRCPFKSLSLMVMHSSLISESMIPDVVEYSGSLKTLFIDTIPKTNKRMVDSEGLMKIVDNKRLRKLTLVANINDFDSSQIVSAFKDAEQIDTISLQSTGYRLLNFQRFIEFRSLRRLVLNHLNLNLSDLVGLVKESNSPTLVYLKLESLTITDGVNGIRISASSVSIDPLFEQLASNTSLQSLILSKMEKIELSCDTIVNFLNHNYTLKQLQIRSINTTCPDPQESRIIGNTTLTDLGVSKLNFHLLKNWSGRLKKLLLFNVDKVENETKIPASIESLVLYSGFVETPNVDLLKKLILNGGDLANIRKLEFKGKWSIPQDFLLDSIHSFSRLQKLIIKSISGSQVIQILSNPSTLEHIIIEALLEYNQDEELIQLLCSEDSHIRTFRVDACDSGQGQSCETFVNQLIRVIQSNHRIASIGIPFCGDDDTYDPVELDPTLIETFTTTIIQNLDYLNTVYICFPANYKLVQIIKILIDYLLFRE